MFAKPFWSPLHAGSVQTFLPGEQVINPCPGDFILTHGNSWTSYMIRFGQKIRYWGPDNKFTRWNHAAIFINAKGDIIEALGGGVQQRNISVYRQTEYHVVHLENVIDPNRDHEVRFAQACLNDHYGWLTILSIALAFSPARNLASVSTAKRSALPSLPAASNEPAKFSLPTPGTSCLPILPSFSMLNLATAMPPSE